MAGSLAYCVQSRVQVLPLCKSPLAGVPTPITMVLKKVSTCFSEYHQMISSFMLPPSPPARACIQRAELNWGQKGLLLSPPAPPQLGPRLNLEVGSGSKLTLLTAVAPPNQEQEGTSRSLHPPSLPSHASVSGPPSPPFEGTQSCSQPGWLRWLWTGAENKLVSKAALQLQRGWADL